MYFQKNLIATSVGPRTAFELDPNPPRKLGREQKEKKSSKGAKFYFLLFMNVDLILILDNLYLY